MDPTMTTKKSLVAQVKSDLDRHEGFREFAYPDPLSALFKKYPREKWGFVPARQILNELGVKVEDAEKLGAPWTYGYGFTQGSNVDSRITKIAAERKLETHILEEDAKLSKALSWYGETSFTTRTVLINMAFNLGLKGLLGFKNTLNYMMVKNYKQAAANMRKSLWHRQVGGRAEELSVRIETQTISAKHLVANFSNVQSSVSSTAPKAL